MRTAWRTFRLPRRILGMLSSTVPARVESPPRRSLQHCDHQVRFLRQCRRRNILRLGADLGGSRAGALEGGLAIVLTRDHAADRGPAGLRGDEGSWRESKIKVWRVGRHGQPPIDEAIDLLRFKAVVKSRLFLEQRSYLADEVCI